MNPDRPTTPFQAETPAPAWEVDDVPSALSDPLPLWEDVDVPSALGAPPSVPVGWRDFDDVPRVLLEADESEDL